MKNVEVKKWSNPIYLGEYQGDRVWLRQPSWDCGWYYGFGYVGNRNLHTHYDSVCLSKIETYNCEKHGYTLSPFVHILTDSPSWKNVPFTKSTLWQLSDLMKSFYSLKECADVVGRGSSNYASTKKKYCLNKPMSRKINNVLLPNVFNGIYELLTDSKNKI